jgi:GH25 family lysozyme M1 (1,4-beta-N-acetylmuramidase)
MRRFLLLFTLAQLLTFSALGFAVATEFDQPWRDPIKAIVIDPYEKNELDWRMLSTDPRLVGIIHRATIGLRIDKQYSARKVEAKERGYKWGSYHLGLPGDPIKQAHFYLDAIKPWKGDLIALDIESLDSRTSMSIHDAALFIAEVQNNTGRYPLLYANDAVAKEISKAKRDDIFSRTNLWYARFRRSISDFPHGVWTTYVLWQFSSEVNCRQSQENPCLYRVPGTKEDMDVSIYNGSIQQLKEAWPLSGRIAEK